MKTSPKKKLGQVDKVTRRALVYERALHRWDKWLDSITYGRKVLRYRQAHPSLEEMKDVANIELTKMGFPLCPVFGLYWLCCVFADYETKSSFYFEKLILPDWFPFPSEFKWDKFGFSSIEILDFKGKRIIPPEIWNEADREFWFDKDPFIRSLPSEDKAAHFDTFYIRDFILVLPADHPVREYVKRGRPITTKSDGETLIE